MKNVTYKRLLLTLIGVLHLAGHAETASSQTWTTGSLVGKQIELIDDNLVQQIVLATNGAAPATIGRKNGPIAAPLFTGQPIKMF